VVVVVVVVVAGGGGIPSLNETICAAGELVYLSIVVLAKEESRRGEGVVGGGGGRGGGWGRGRGGKSGGGRREGSMGASEKEVPRDASRTRDRTSGGRSAHMTHMTVLDILEDTLLGPPRPNSRRTSGTSRLDSHRPNGYLQSRSKSRLDDLFLFVEPSVEPPDTCSDSTSRYDHKKEGVGGTEGRRGMGVVGGPRPLSLMQPAISNSSISSIGSGGGGSSSSSETRSEWQHKHRGSSRLVSVRTHNIVRLPQGLLRLTVDICEIQIKVTNIYIYMFGLRQRERCNLKCV
jgi:hypothetical protein